MSVSKKLFEIFEKNFTVMSEKFEDSIHQIAQVYNGLHLSYPFFINPFIQKEGHGKSHLHSQHAKTEHEIKRKTP